MRWLDDIIDSMDISLSKLQEMVEGQEPVLQSMGSQRVDALKLCVVLEKTLESPLDSKEIKPVNPKGNQL